MPLILFDIDGTLVDCVGQVRPLFAAALEEVFGTTGDLDHYDFSGKTDPRIVLDLLTGAGIPAAAVLDRLPAVREGYLWRLAEGLKPERMRLLPGVIELLNDLSTRADTVLGLLTGNWEHGARIKLAAFDLNRYFSFGAYGDDQIDRRDLPPVALLRAQEVSGRHFRTEEILLIGDSVLDVECGLAHGFAMLAVATGRTPITALQAAGATWVVPDLTALPGLLALPAPFAA